MKTQPLHVCPVLSPDEAKRFEEMLFGGDEMKEWAAMIRAGAAVGAAVLEDFKEIGGFPSGAARVLVLAGKGHNGGDALLAAKFILERFPNASAEVVLVFGEGGLKPLAMRAYRELVHAAKERVSVKEGLGKSYALCLDGIFGFQFRPPIRDPARTLLSRVNDLPIRFRAAIDLPSGLGGPGSSGAVFSADFTYATGIVKSPLFTDMMRASAGRIRYLDLGFFERGVVLHPKPGPDEMVDEHTVLTARSLDALRTLRSPFSDKRTFGHLFVVGGSRRFPGAVLMSVMAALKAGAGLVTAFVPESLAAAYAAQVPEAMWVAWPETPEGGLSLEGTHLFRERAGRATALLIGPGLGSEAETLALAADLVRSCEIPLILDADALQPDVVRVGKASCILTPHAGEFARISGRQSLKEFSKESGFITVLKGPMTSVGYFDAQAHSFFGGPVLARGGSGDLLAGMIGGLLAGNAQDPFVAACRGVVWHGMAADALARARGQTAVRTTELLEFLPAVLREER